MEVATEALAAPMGAMRMKATQLEALHSMALSSLSRSMVPNPVPN
jgi:ABC-type transporter Mla maintaining outer membrane lipid asymmetry permease subunit MlaE